MSILQCYAIDVNESQRLMHRPASAGNSNCDHTYVISDDGKKWGCFGCDEDPDKAARLVFSNPGDSDKAQALAKENVKGCCAGIAYTFNGVCHQAANRILYPTDKTLDTQVRGYAVSAAVWGVYGTRVAPYVLDPISYGIACAVVYSLWNKRLEDNGYSIPEETQDNAARLLQTKKAMDMKAEMFSIFKKRQGIMLKKKKSIQQRILKSGKVEGKSIADDLNGIINNMLSDMNNKLGGENFNEIFHLKAGEEVNLVNPDLAAEFYADKDFKSYIKQIDNFATGMKELY